jgi:hypothetical protein
MAATIRWRKGWDDAVPLAVLAIPMALGAFLAGPRTSYELVLVVAAVVAGLLLKHLLPEPIEDLSIVPAVIALLVELSTVPLSVELLLLAAASGVGLLLWAGTAPTTDVALSQRLEPALVPALAVGLALVVMFFLPVGTGAQVGLAALALVAVLGLVAWLYLRSADEASVPEPTS